MAQRKSIIKLIKCLRFQRQLSSLKTGTLYEHKACRYLKRQALHLIHKNFRCHLGEIDLIMQDQEYLVFVEVRYRQHSQRLSGLESVDYHKQQRLIKVAEYYLQTIKEPERACRFDIVSFDQDRLDWIKGAF